MFTVSSNHSAHTLPPPSFFDGTVSLGLANTMEALRVCGRLKNSEKSTIRVLKRNTNYFGIFIMLAVSSQN